MPANGIDPGASTRSAPLPDGDRPTEVAALRATLLDGLATVSEFAEAISRSERTVHGWIARGMPTPTWAGSHTSSSIVRGSGFYRDGPARLPVGPGGRVKPDPHQRRRDALASRIRK